MLRSEPRGFYLRVATLLANREWRLFSADFLLQLRLVVTPGAYSQVLCRGGKGSGLCEPLKATVNSEILSPVSLTALVSMRQTSPGFFSLLDATTHCMLSTRPGCVNGSVISFVLSFSLFLSISFALSFFSLSLSLSLFLSTLLSLSLSSLFL